MPKQKALFLDRDGIINVDHGYVSKIDDFEFVEGIFDLIRIFADAGYLIFVVTNQSGIGRGYYTQEKFETLTRWMIQTFHANDIEIKEVQYCPHIPQENCQCRKPNIGMIKNILANHDIDLNSSWMIGDKQSDIDLAHNADIGSSIAVGKRTIKNSTYSFESILHCKKYLEENKDTIS